MTTFAVTAVSETVTLKAVVPEGKKEPTGFTGQASYTVSNTSSQTVTAVVGVSAKEPASKAWLALMGPASFTLPPQGTAQCSVQINCPAGTAAGTYSGTILVKNDADPDEDSTGQAVSFVVPASKAPKKPFPWWIVAVAAIVVIGGLVTWKLLSGGTTTVKVPNVVGQSESPAVSALVQASLSPKPDFSTGVVASQNPSPGASASPGSAVTLTVRIPLPNFVGQGTAAAVAAATQAGLKPTANFTGGVVATQAPAAGTQVTPGSAVTLSVNVTVPAVIGQQLGQAVANLNAAGLQVAAQVPKPCSSPSGTVVGQSPAQGTTVPARTAVNLTFSTGIPFFIPC